MPPSPIVDSVLRYPVHTLEGELLLPAGARLTADALDALAEKGRRVLEPPSSLMRHESVFRDMIEFICEGPYRVVFEDCGRFNRLMKTMEKVSLPRPLLRSLDWFKAHDPFTYRHILCVFVLSSLIAGDLLGDPEEAVRGAASGPLHDFGKTCVPLSILQKRTPLTRTERARVDHHACAGFVLLAYHLGDRGTAAGKVALEHHERRDGSGYPFGILLSDPMVEIVAVCDVYDALISPRPYRPTCYDNRTALEELTLLAEEGRLDHGVVQALVAVNRRSKPDYRECRLSLEKRGHAPEDNAYGLTAEESEGLPAPAGRETAPVPG